MTNTSDMREAERLAREFHKIYEELAPSYGYETKVDTRNFDPSTPNGRLMISTCQKLIEQWQSQQAKGEPVGKVMTVGGYPDESEHTVEWLCKYKDLKDGDLLYTACPAPEHAAEAGVCQNCETALPEGCGGIFAHDGTACRYGENQQEEAER